MPFDISAASNAELAQAIYIAYYGRIAEPDGLDFWENEAQTLSGQGLSNEDILVNFASRFADVEESQNEFPFLANPTESGADGFVQNVFNALFGRAAEQAGEDFYSDRVVDQLNAGEPIGDIILDILNGAQNEDADILGNKVAAAQAYTTALVNGSLQYDQAESETVLSNRTATETQAEAAQAGTDAASDNAPQSGGEGETFALSAGVDNIEGTSGDDTIRGAIDDNTAADNTLTVVDTVDGAGGIDTFNIVVGPSGGAVSFPAAQVTNVENFFFRNVSSQTFTVDATLFSGEQQLWADRASDTTTITGVSSGTTIGMNGNGVTTNGTLNFTTAAGVTAATVAIANGTTAGAINVSDPGSVLTEASISSSGDANTVGAIDLDADTGGASVKSLTVDASTDLTTGNITNFAADATVTVKGDGAVDLGTQEAAVDTIDASDNSGGLTLALDAEADTKFTGGSGDDMVTAGTSYTSANTASIDGGDGTGDRVVVNATGNMDAASGAKYSNFEELEVGSGATVNLNHLSANNSIDSVRLEADAGGAVGATKMTADQAGNVTLFAAGTGVAGNVTTGVSGAATVGQLDTVSITTSGDNAAVTANNIVAAGVETLEIAAETGSATTTVSALAHQDWTTLNLSGSSDISVTSAAGAANVNSTVDGSGAAGALTLDFSNSTTNGINLQGGSGNDAITGGGSDDIMTGNGGDDEFNFAAAGTAGVDTVTDFAAGGSGDTAAFAAGDTTAGTTSGNDAVFASEGTSLVTGGGSFTLASSSNTNDVIELTTALDDDVTLDASSTGADLLQALSSDGTAASDITVSAASDAVMLAVYQGGDAFLFNVAEGSADTAAVAGDITLVGVFNGVESGAFADGDFTIV